MIKKKKHKKHPQVARPRLTGSLVFFSIAGLLTLILLIVRAMASRNPAISDFFVDYIFKPLATIWTWPVSLIPFSLTELFVVAGIPALIALLIYGIVRLIRNSAHRGRRAVRTIVVVAGTALLMLSLFIVFHGMNYARSPLADSLGLDIRERSVDELDDAARMLARAAVEVREGLPEDEDGVLSMGSLNHIQNTAFEGWEEASVVWPSLQSSVRAKPKGVLLSHYWSYTNIVGLYMPLLVETNINIDQPDFMIPATAAHEIAHSRGFAREGDGDFASLLSCFHHPDPVWQYSGLISAWKSVGNRLWAEDRDRWNLAYVEELSPAVIRDLNAESAYWKAFETEIAVVSEKINDAYLKTNQEEDGVKSYGAVVDLLLAWIETPNATILQAAAHTD